MISTTPLLHSTSHLPMEADLVWEYVWEQWAADAFGDHSRCRKRARQRAAASGAAAEVRQRKPRKREEFKRLPLNPEEPAGFF